MLLVLVLLWTSVRQVIWIVTNVTSAIGIRSSGHKGSRLRWWIAFGFIILALSRSSAQVWMLGWWLSTIFESTVFVSMIYVCTSLLARRIATLLAKGNLSLFLFIVMRVTWFRFEISGFRFEIRSVRSLSFFIKTIILRMLLFRRWRLLSFWFVRFIVLIFRIRERRGIKTKLSCMIV